MKELLLIHDDNSVTILPDASYWESDPDMYAWREESEYIVDCQLSIFRPNPTCEKHSNFQQAWIKTEDKIEVQELRELIAKDLSPEMKSRMGYLELIQHLQQNEN